MIRKSQTENPVLVIPLHGRLQTQDFLLLTNLIAAGAASRSISRLLLDWSEVTSWDFRRPSHSELRVWLDDADRIDRLAILHNRIGNRQAALLGALLRERECRVRSYRVTDRDRAIDWLIERKPGNEAISLLRRG